MNVSKTRLKEIIEEELETMTTLDESQPPGWWHDPRKIADMILNAFVDHGLDEEFATDFLQRLPLSIATDFLKEYKGKWWDFEDHDAGDASEEDTYGEEY